MFECFNKKKDLLRSDVTATNQKLLWCPFALRQKEEMKTNGTYPKNYPQGAVVHFTAGRDETEKDALGTLDYGRKQGYSFFVIGPTGVVYQASPLNRWGSHAGESAWPVLGNSVSTKLVGIEVCNAGKLEKCESGFKSWFGKIYKLDEVRIINDSTDNILRGVYKKITQAQEESLIGLILWLKKNNPEVFNLEYVLGHDEVAGPKGIGRWRKSDPGGSLSCTMTEFRKKLSDEYKIYQKSFAIL